MSDQIANKSAVAGHSQVGAVETAPPPSASPYASSQNRDSALHIGAGLLLAVPLTALVKMVADLHPSLCHLSNMLALTPRPIPRWVRFGETIVERTIPYLRGGPGMKPGGSVSPAGEASSP